MPDEKTAKKSIEELVDAEVPDKNPLFRQDVDWQKVLGDAKQISGKDIDKFGNTISLREKPFTMEYLSLDKEGSGYTVCYGLLSSCYTHKGAVGGVLHEIGHAVDCENNYFGQFGLLIIDYASKREPEIVANKWAYAKSPESFVAFIHDTLHHAVQSFATGTVSKDDYKLVLSQEVRARLGEKIKDPHVKKIPELSSLLDPKNIKLYSVHEK